MQHEKSIEVEELAGGSETVVVLGCDAGIRDRAASFYLAWDDDEM